MRALHVSLALALLAGTPPLTAAEVAVRATQISSFGETALDGTFGQLIFRGGLALVAQDDTFGGLSGLTSTGSNQQVSFVTDRGSFVAGQLAYDESGRLFGLIGVTVEPMQNSQGDPLPRQYAKDAEGIDTIYRNGEPVAVRVVFEHLTRVADFDLIEGVPGGPAREVSIPQWLTDLRTNASLESVCVAPPASPIAGSTLLLTEDHDDGAGHHSGWLLGQADKGPISYQKDPVVYPTACAFLPNGDLLVLERGVSMLSFAMTLRRVAAADVRPGAVMAGELLLAANGSEIDNMEALAVHTAPDGELRILIGSDNNFNDWQRSLLLEFALPN
ncbi:esterase-like activity of phytase family protein [Devosia sp.]|uniref:esterase-like activity of phytase family protein n=1 Tax=Devosia sp. TaxID=1871048 RepID=UPI0027330524|nr:esterase-like activity of phytase family protein [Devosia sp.]MDP2780519.1 esterase-like activity of phytase family protein [Devosia sp.]